MNSNQAKNTIKRRKALKKEQKRLGELIWKTSISSNSYAVYQQRLKEVDKELSEMHPDSLFAFQSMLTVGQKSN